MILYLIRHAQSENNALAEKLREMAGEFDELSYDEYRFKRSADPSLTEIGFRQAGILAEYLKSATPKHRAGYGDAGDIEPGEFSGNPFGITHLYCSPMLRTLQTTLPIARALDVRPQIWVDIHEHGGMFEHNADDGSVKGHPGLGRADILSDFPDWDVPEEVTDEGWWFEHEEDRPSCHGRAIRVAVELHKLAKEQKDSRIALVSHGTFLDSLLKALTGRLPGAEFHYGLYNTSITRLDFTTSYESGLPFTVVRYTNRVDHLSPDLIT